MKQQFGSPKNADCYAQLGLRTTIETASPHRIILMLLEGAISKIAAARLALKNGNIADKGANISWAISIIDGLRASLDLDSGGELAANLDQLYDYMARTLVTANLENNPDRLDEVEQLINEIRHGWKDIENAVTDTAVVPHNEVGPTAVGRG